MSRFEFICVLVSIVAGRGLNQGLAVISTPHAVTLGWWLALMDAGWPFLARAIR
jgi:hypothetical protein